MAPFVETSRTYRQGSRTLPGRYYTSARIFDAERARIFERHWICADRESRIQEPGDYLVTPIGGESIIVLRDGTRAARAFYNVCRHRGTRLREPGGGKLPGEVRCPYHAWTYSLDGDLIGAPHMEEVDGFDPGDYPLHAALVDSWEGFLFVNLLPRPTPLAEAFSPLLHRFARFNLPRLQAWRRIEYDIRANWKLLCQNYSECLHCPIIHPALARLTHYRSGENDLTEGPFLGGFMSLSKKDGSMTRSGRTCSRPVGDLSKEEMGRVYYYTIFPNLLLSLHPDYAMFHTLWPEAPDRTRVTCEWLFHPAAFDAPGFDPEEAVEFWDETNRQDWHICELAQAGVSSRMYRPGPYSPRESIPAAWDREYLEQMEAPAGR